MFFPEGMRQPDLPGILFSGPHIRGQFWGEGVAKKLSVGQRNIFLLFFHSFNKYLPKSCFRLGTVLGTGSTLVNTDKLGHHPCGTFHLVGEIG